MGERHRDRVPGKHAPGSRSVLPSSERPSPSPVERPASPTLFVEPWTFPDPPEQPAAGMPADLIGSYFF